MNHHSTDDDQAAGIQHLSVSRRHFLAAAGLIGAGTAVGLTRVGFSSENGAGPDAGPPAHNSVGADPARQWAFVIDLRRCDGCKKCTEACQTEHYLSKDQEWIKVYETVDENGNKSFMPRPCMQCENPPCLKVCPVRATFKNPEGVVLVDQSRCIGCRLCMAACPYEARYFNYDEPAKPPAPLANINPMPEYPVPQQRGTVGKCVLCVHFTDIGKLPACVGGCAMDALYIAELNSDVMTNASGETFKLSKFLRDNDAFRFREELNTSPRVWYVAGHAQDLDY
jgi:molybdopterin-containing oxidoreductase family iron-sulfur binding subunit